MSPVNEDGSIREDSKTISAGNFSVMKQAGIALSANYLISYSYQKAGS